MWEIIVAGAAAIKIPSLLESAVKSVGERLLGPFLDSLAQPIKDRAAQRSRVAQAVADLAIREVSEKPELFQAEINRLIKQNGARTDRIEATFTKSLHYLADDVREEASTYVPEPPSDDWLNRWSRYVEDASSDDLQDAFARILAGEIKRKGAFSIGTLRLVSEMSMEIAADFQALWSEVIDDYAIKHQHYNRSEGWARLSRLREAGLASFSDASIHRPSGPLWSFGNGPSLLIEVDPAIYSEVPIINITHLGVELGSILPTPNKIANLRRLATDCPDKRGWKSATLLEGTRTERIWTKSETA